MPVIMTTVAEERSTLIMKCTFAEPTGTTVTPISAVYTWADENGTVINGRSSVSMTLASVSNIVLTGTDLQITESFPADVYRFLTVSATYDSDTYGTGLHLRDQARIKVANLTSIS